MRRSSGRTRRTRETYSPGRADEEARVRQLIAEAESREGLAAAGAETAGGAGASEVAAGAAADAATPGAGERGSPGEGAGKDSGGVSVPVSMAHGAVPAARGTAEAPASAAEPAERTPAGGSPALPGPGASQAAPQAPPDPTGHGTGAAEAAAGPTELDTAPVAPGEGSTAGAEADAVAPADAAEPAGEPPAGAGAAAGAGKGLGPKRRSGAKRRAAPEAPAAAQESPAGAEGELGDAGAAQVPAACAPAKRRRLHKLGGAAPAGRHGATSDPASTPDPAPNPAHETPADPNGPSAEKPLARGPEDAQQDGGAEQSALGRAARAKGAGAMPPPPAPGARKTASMAALGRAAGPAAAAAGGAKARARGARGDAGGPRADAGGPRASAPERTATRTLNASLGAALESFGRAHAEAVGLAEQARSAPSPDLSRVSGARFGQFDARANAGAGGEMPIAHLHL